jgi:zinc protease
MGNSILGQFGMMGRIGESIREQAGLAYYAYSSLSSSIGPGPWAVSAGVNPKNEEKAIDLIKKELKRFVTELVDEEELKDNQANFIGRIPLSLESNIGVASSLIHIEKHQLGLDYYIRYPDVIRAITREKILSAAKKYLDPDKMVTAIAGPPLKD